MTVLLLLKRHLIYRQNQLFIFYTLYVLVMYLYYHSDCTGAHDT